MIVTVIIIVLPLQAPHPTPPTHPTTRTSTGFLVHFTRGRLTFRNESRMAGCAHTYAGKQTGADGVRVWEAPPSPSGSHTYTHTQTHSYTHAPLSPSISLSLARSLYRYVPENIDRKKNLFSVFERDEYT